jgi:hypothetical protein
MALWNKILISTTVFILQHLNNKERIRFKTETFFSYIHITKSISDSKIMEINCKIIQSGRSLKFAIAGFRRLTLNHFTFSSRSLAAFLDDLRFAQAELEVPQVAQVGYLAYRRSKWMQFDLVSVWLHEHFFLRPDLDPSGAKHFDELSRRPPLSGVGVRPDGDRLSRVGNPSGASHSFGCLSITTNLFLYSSVVRVLFLD